MLEEAGLRVLAGTKDAAEAREFLTRRDIPLPAVLVVAACPGGGSSGDGLDCRALAAALRQELSRGDDHTGPRSLGVVYIGEHASALGGDALGPGEQFLSEPFG